MEEIKFLIYTILIETPVALVLLRNIPWRRVLFIAVCVNMVSHPIAWFLVYYGFSWWLVEGLVFIFEGAIFYLLFPSARIRAGLVAVAMNLVSALVGHFFFKM